MPQLSSAIPDDPVQFVDSHAKLTVAGETLAGRHKIHAFAILVLPVFGAAVAAWLAWRNGIGATEVISLVVMYSVSWIGITVGYHRHFSHRSFRAHPAARVLLGAFGSIACQGPVNYWVSNHRRHHRFSDKPGDVHSPVIRRDERIGGLRGFLHSHIGWTFNHPISNTAVVARDLLADPIASWVNRYYFLLLALGFILPGVVAGAVTHSLYGALMGVLWGGFVRLLLCYHSTNTITSLTHIWGRRPYASNDQSRNNIWLAIPTWGESWHNNHHAFPTSAAFGQRWWQIDLGTWFIHTLEFFHLASDVKQTSREAQKAKLARSARA